MKIYSPIWLLCALALGGSARGAEPDKAGPPNLVIIYADDKYY